MFSVYSSRDTGSYNPLHRCMRSILLQIKQHFHLFFITTTKNKVKCLRPTGKFFPLKNFQVQNQHLPWMRENPKQQKQQSHLTTHHNSRCQPIILVVKTSIQWRMRSRNGSWMLVTKWIDVHNGARGKQDFRW